MTAALILNVLFSAFVVIGIVGHLAWAVVRDRRTIHEHSTRRRRRAATARPAYARRGQYPIWTGAR